MRRIAIPEEAIKRHQETLGANLMPFLKRLANGERVSWRVSKKEEKHRDKILGVLQNKRCVAYWKWVDSQFNGYDILIAEPARLVMFARESVNKFQALGKREKKAVLEVTRRLFSYNSFRVGKVLLAAKKECAYKIQWFCPEVEKDCVSRKKKTKKVNEHEKEFRSWSGWGIAEFVRLLDVRYCPYCNAETVGTAHLPSREYVPDIDHILPKGVYPLLSLSLYNLVPTCNRCNSRFKKEADMLEGWDGRGSLPDLHPYVHNIYKHIRFDYKPTSVSKMYLKPYSKGPLTVAASQRSGAEQIRSEKHIGRYHLGKIYNDLYSNEINEFLWGVSICSPDFVDSMSKLCRVGKSEFERMICHTSLNPHDINHYRFAKLIGDLHAAICFDTSDENKERIMRKLKDRFRGQQNRGCIAPTGK